MSDDDKNLIKMYCVCAFFFSVHIFVFISYLFVSFFLFFSFFYFLADYVACAFCNRIMYVLTFFCGKPLIDSTVSVPMLARTKTKAKRINIVGLTLF